jgi:hypothetical protein
VVELPFAADCCPCVEKLRTVLPFTVGIRDGAVHLVSTLCSAPGHRWGHTTADGDHPAARVWAMPSFPRARGSLSGLACVTTRPAGYPSGGAPTSCQEAAPLTYYCVCKRACKKLRLTSVAAAVASACEPRATSCREAAPLTYYCAGKRACGVLRLTSVAAAVVSACEPRAAAVAASTSNDAPRARCSREPSSRDDSITGTSPTAAA